MGALALVMSMSRDFSSRQQLITALKRELRAGDRVLIKGSRRAAMEQVVQALAADGED